MNQNLSNILYSVHLGIIMILTVDLIVQRFLNLTLCLHVFITEFQEFDVKPTIFSYKELCHATKGFDPDMKVGEGGFGAVYKVIFDIQD